MARCLITHNRVTVVIGQVAFPPFIELPVGERNGRAFAKLRFIVACKMTEVPEAEVQCDGFDRSFLRVCDFECAAGGVEPAGLDKMQRTEAGDLPERSLQRPFADARVQTE